MPGNLILPGGEPFFYPGGPIGALLIHGFTGAPAEMRWMGEDLARRGFSVLGVRLAGHATRPEDMARQRWTDWLASVEDGLALLCGVTQRQFVVGLSMGGALALLAAARLPVTGAVAISVPFKLPDDWRLPFIRPLSRLMPRLEKGPADWKNPEAAVDHVDYPYNPTPSIAELRDLLAEMRLALPSIRVPVMLAHSTLDASVDPVNQGRILRLLGSPYKLGIMYERSNHVITREPDRFELFETAAHFMQGVVAAREGDA
jgi:carboxylesterase